jgi:predicted nucleic acid-binding protein
VPQAVAGPLLFDTSAESWFARATDPSALEWMRAYLGRYQVHVSAITVLERVHGYALHASSVSEDKRPGIEAARSAYVRALGHVWPIDASVGITAAEIMALVPGPPSPPRRSHRLAESRQDRLVRWRFDCMIAATALVAELPLMHNNAPDFEAIRAAVAGNSQRFPKLGPLSLIRCTSPGLPLLL